MRVVTSGSAYVDIDAYAGCVAFAELLQAQGVEARAVSTAPLNESITKTVRSWAAPFDVQYQPSAADTFTLIDISNPDNFDPIVRLERVDEVIDHHLGFEQYWYKYPAVQVDIEFIGAACTQVYEKWKASGLLNKLSVISARLLICGILDNTLNFGAKVTTPRDKAAYDDLLARADLPTNWTAHYFAECQDAILQDVATALTNDAKTLGFKTFPHDMRVGQLVLWDAKEVLEKHQAVLEDTLAGDQPWFLNLVSVSEPTSYFFTTNPDVQAWLAGLLSLRFDGPLAHAGRLWLRKEIVKQDLSK